MLMHLFVTLRACDHYTSARLLVEGVMMTACEPQDRETLHQFAMSFTDRLAHCRQLLESHDLLLPPSIVSIKAPPPQLFSSMSIRASTSTSAPSTPNFCIPHPSLHQSQGQGQGQGQGVGLGQGLGQGQGQGRDVSSSSRASPGDLSMMRHFGHDPIVGPL